MCQREWVQYRWGGGVSERNRLQDDVCTIKYWICMYLWLYLSKKDSVLRVELGERERDRKTPMDFESSISTAEIKMLSCFLIVKNIFDK